MNLSSANTLIPLIAASSYTLLLITAYTRRDQQGQQTRWLLAFLSVSIFWELSLYIAQDIVYPPNFPAKVLLIGTTLLGVTTAVFVNWSQRRRWIFFGGMAIVATLLLDILLPTQVVNIPFSNRTISYSDLVTTLTWLILSGVILSRTWQDYRVTTFPWHANRLLFWLIVLSLTFIGEALLFFHFTGLTLAGQIVRFIGVAGLAHALTSHRIVDVRTSSQSALVFLLINMIAVIPMAAVIWFLQPSTDNQILFFVTIIFGLLLYTPIHRFVEKIFRRLRVGESLDINQVLRHYSQEIYQILDVQQLSRVIIGTLSELLDSERGALMLVSKEEAGYDIEPIPAFGVITREIQHIPQDCSFIQILAHLPQPLLQYELDFNREFSGISPDVRGWLKRIAMDVFVPVTAGNRLEGIIAVGPKASGLPYQASELGLMQILADQTVIALQNARLYSELGQQNKRIQRLNENLINQNERLEILDHVKSDFITIASHELRTPLTQVKGYTDILQSMNEEAALEQEQTQTIISHISQASDRLESLITAMLDASQLDTEGFSLVFVEAKLGSIINLALEPLGLAMSERHITWLADGLDTIPTMYVDPKRLVQVFTNLIGNAIKYTPDHGNISLTAKLIPGQNELNEYVEIVLQDEGIGIDPKYHALIFEKFFRVEDPQLHSTGSTKFKGAGPGLGLPIAKGVIEGHGGHIWVESEGEDENRLPGSRFHIVLPLYPPQMSEVNDKILVEKSGFSFLPGKGQASVEIP